MVKKKPVLSQISQSHQNAIDASKLGYKVIGTTVFDPSGKPVKLYRCASGYPAFIVRENSITKKRFVRVHQLVAWEKYGVDMLLAELIRHIDGNKNNFNYNNILLGTWQDNMDDFWNNKNKKNAI